MARSPRRAVPPETAHVSAVTVTITPAWKTSPKRVHATATNVIAAATTSSAPTPSKTACGLSRRLRAGENSRGDAGGWSQGGDGGAGRCVGAGDGGGAAEGGQ